MSYSPFKSTDLGRLVFGYVAIVIHLIAQGLQHSICDFGTSNTQPNRMRQSALVTSAALGLPLGVMGYVMVSLSFTSGILCSYPLELSQTF